MITDKYAKISDDLEKKKDKVILTDDAYALCEFLEKLTDRLGEKLKW